MEDLSTSERNKVTSQWRTENGSNIIYMTGKSLVCAESTHPPLQDLRTNTGETVEGGQVAGDTSDRRGRQAYFFSAMDPLEEPLPDLKEFTSDEPLMVHFKHMERPDHEVYTFDLKIAQDRGLTFIKPRSFAITMYDTKPSAALVRVVNLKKPRRQKIFFDTRSAKVTDVTWSSSSVGTKENPVQRSIETARVNPLRGDSDAAQVSSIDLRVKGEPDNLTEQAEHKNALTDSVADDESSSAPNYHKLMAKLFTVGDVSESKGHHESTRRSRSSRNSHHHRRGVVQCVLRLFTSRTHVLPLGSKFCQEPATKLRNKLPSMW